MLSRLRSVRLLFALTLVVGLAGCIPFGPKRLDYWPTPAVMRVDDDRFGILLYPCGRGQVTSVTLSFADRDGPTETAVLRETYVVPVDIDTLMVTTGVDDPPSVDGAKREVLDADLLQRFNTDKSFVSYEVGDRPTQSFVLDARDASGESLPGTFKDAAGRRFHTDTGMVTVDFDIESEPIESFTCPQDKQAAWRITPPQSDSSSSSSGASTTS